MMTVNGELPPIQYTHGEAPQLVLVQEITRFLGGIWDKYHE